MQKVLIVEDEEKARILLRKYAEQYCDLKVIGEAGTVDEAEMLVREQNPDIIFLDISLPVHSGFELLDRFEKHNFEVIFITAFDMYAIRAIKISAVDYLLKPVSINELKEAVEKAKERIRQKDNNKNLKNLLDNLTTNELDQRITIFNGKDYVYEKLSDIIRFEANGRYTDIYLKNGTKYLATKNLGEYESSLDSLGFIRVHHSHLINENHISMIGKNMANGVVMSDGAVVDISRRYKDKIKSKLQNKMK